MDVYDFSTQEVLGGSCDRSSHTTRDIQVLNLEMVRLFLIDWAL